MSVGVESSHWQIAKRLCLWANSEARPCQQSCRDGLRMSALLSKKLQKAAWSCLCINIHFLVESFNAAAATAPGDDAYGLFCISYECNLAHYLHIVKTMFCFYTHIIRADPKALPSSWLIKGNKKKGNAQSRRYQRQATRINCDFTRLVL